MIPVIVLSGYSRPLIRVSDYLELLERSTYTGDRVRSCGIKALLSSADSDASNCGPGGWGSWGSPR